MRFKFVLTILAFLCGSLCHAAEKPWSHGDLRVSDCGHTYGNNNIMQFIRPGLPGAYFADGVSKPWYVAIDDPADGSLGYYLTPGMTEIPENIILKEKDLTE